MRGFRVKFFKKVLGGNGHEVDACQYAFETLANNAAEAEERAKKAFCEDHHLMNWTIHADRCQAQQADVPSSELHAAFSAAVQAPPPSGAVLVGPALATSAWRRGCGGSFVGAGTEQAASEAR